MLLLYSVLFSAIMRLSNELVYAGALQCANDEVATATLHTSLSPQQVCSRLVVVIVVVVVVLSVVIVCVVVIVVVTDIP